MEHDFKEKRTEYSQKQGKQIPVILTSKYAESKTKAIELIDSGKYGLSDSDFWILMNENKAGQMLYSGLIISHNGCLKINDKLEIADKFDASCVSVDTHGYGDSLVCFYQSPDQGLFEVGEISPKNCKNGYPYAMAVKRLFDRVVLKLSKVAYAGIYGEDEADEFRRRYDDDLPKKEPAKAEKKPEQKKEENPAEDPLAKQKANLKAVCKKMDLNITEILGQTGWQKGEIATQEHLDKAFIILKEISDARSEDEI